MKPGLWAVIIMVMVGLLVAACAPPSAAPPTTTPKAPEVSKPGPTPTAAPKALVKEKIMVPSKGATLFPFWMGKDKGFFKDEGVDLEIPIVKAPLQPAALLSGEANYAGQASGLFETSLMGSPIKVLAAIMWKALWWVYGGPEVKTAADLKGKSFGITSIGAGAYYSVQAALKSLGLDPVKDVVYIVMPPAEQLVALEKGAIAAAALVPPLNVTADKKGFHKIVFTGDVFDLPGNGLSTTDKKLKDDRDQVKRVTRALIKTMNYWKANKEETTAYIMKEFETQKDEAEALFEFMVKISSFDGNISRQGFENLIQLARNSGQIKTAITVDEAMKKAVDFSPLQEVQKELGLAR